MSSKLLAEQYLANRLRLSVTEVRADPELRRAVDNALASANRTAAQRARNGVEMREAMRRAGWRGGEPSTMPNEIDIYSAVSSVALPKQKPKNEEPRKHTGRWDDPLGVWPRKWF